MPPVETVYAENLSLMQENAELRARLDFATARARGVLEQVRFLRQQTGIPVPSGDGAAAGPRRSR